MLESSGHKFVFLKGISESVVGSGHMRCLILSLGKAAIL